LITGTFKVWC